MIPTEWKKTVDPQWTPWAYQFQAFLRGGCISPKSPAICQIGQSAKGTFCEEFVEHDKANSFNLAEHFSQ